MAERITNADLGLPANGATVFTVIENTPGYLPDADEPATFGTWDEAVDYAESLARELEADGYIVWRSENIGTHWIAHCEPVESTVTYQPRLGRVVEVTREEV